MKRLAVVLGVFGSLAILPAIASAAPITFLGSGGGLSAEATFTIDGDTLTILLINTDTASAGSEWVPSEALTGVFFSLGASALSPVSAITGGNIAQSDKCDVGACTGATTNVSGEFGYAYAGGDFPTGATHGIASTGAFNPLSQPNFPGGADLNSHGNLNGEDFGIVPLTFTDGSGNGGLDNYPLILGSVTLTLSGVSGLTEAGIGNVWFTYGSSKTNARLEGEDPCEVSGEICIPVQLTSTPEPGSLILLGTGLIGAARGLRRRFRK